jgi:hypothetical protein
MTTVEVVCGKLAEDADRWKAAGDAMAAAARAAAGLDLGIEQFGRIADDRGVTEAYEVLQQMFTNLVRGAAAEFDGISATLTDVARTYLLEDQAGAHAMSRIEDRLR